MVPIIGLVYIPFAVVTALLGATRAHIANIETKAIKKTQLEAEVKKTAEVKKQNDMKQKQIVQNLNNILGINFDGIPYSEYGILHLLKNKENIDLSYIYNTNKTLLDIAIDLSSIKAFNQIINKPNIQIETLLHSINYLNETIVRLPKNKTRKQMKIILENKLKELNFDI